MIQKTYEIASAREASEVVHQLQKIPEAVSAKEGLLQVFNEYGHSLKELKPSENLMPADIEDGLFELVKSGVSLAIKSNDPNITPELIEKVFEIPKEYVTVMPSHTVEYYDAITRPAKNGNGALAYPTDKVSIFTMLIAACKKLKSKISFAVTFQSICTVLGFGVCMLCAVVKNSFEFITPLRIVLFQLAVGILSIFLSSIIKRIK